MVRYLILAGALVLAGCATTYQSSGFTGGYSDEHVAEDVYRVKFGANGHATRETAQTYWLYRACELTLEKGFDGFEILSPIALGAAEPSSARVPVFFIFIPSVGGGVPKPSFEADIRLLKGPLVARPPKVFDARALKAALEPFVTADKKCNSGNVCPHIKKYLQPNPTATPAPDATTS
jgi:hypothetical protein